MTPIIKGIHKKDATYKDIDFFRTSQGSVYIYLPDGKTRRIQPAVEPASVRQPSDLMVFVPPFERIRSSCPKDLLQKFGQDGKNYHRTLSYTFYDKNVSVDIATRNGIRLRTNEQAQNSQEDVFLYMYNSKKNEWLTLPVWKAPLIDYQPVDLKFSANRVKSSHLGHEITDIVYKNGTRIFRID